MKKILLYISFLFFGLNAIHADIKYTLEDGVLTIEGTGDMTMPNYSDANRPGWYDVRYDIWEVIIKDGVKNIGDAAFEDCSLFYLTIPNSVTRIGTKAFAGCTSLFSIRISNSVTEIGSLAFYNCASITTVFLPESVKLVGSKAFKGCGELVEFSAYANEDLQLGSGILEDCPLMGAISFYGKNLPSPLSAELSNSEDWNLGLNDNIMQTCELAIPEKFYDKYESIYPWNKFAKENVQKSLNLNDDEEYVNPEGTHIGFTCYVRDFENTEWQALFLPFPLTVEDWSNDLDFAYINDMRQFDTDDDGDIDETWMDIIPIKNGCTYSGWPYLVRAKNTGKRFFHAWDYVLSSDEIGASEGPRCSTTSTEYTFIGNYKIMSGQEMADKDYYGIFNGELTLGDGESILKPCRWYMTYHVYDYTYYKEDDANSAKAIKIHVIGEENDGMTTGIEELRITNSKLPVEDSSIYDLNGRKMNEKSLKPGLYIKNGKKVIIK